MWGSEFTTKAATLQGGSADIVPGFCVSGPWPSCYPRPRLIQKVLGCGVHAVVRGGARCALDVHGRSAKTDACGRSFVVLSTQVSKAGLRLLHKSRRGAHADARGAARCALHVHGRCAKTDACGRSFAVL